MKAAPLRVLDIPDKRIVPGYTIDEDVSGRVFQTDQEDYVWKGRVVTTEEGSMDLLPVLYLPEVVARADLDATVAEYNSKEEDLGNRKIAYAAVTEPGYLIRAPRAVLINGVLFGDQAIDHFSAMSDYLNDKSISVYNDIWGGGFDDGFGAPLPSTSMDEMEEEFAAGIEESWEAEHMGNNGTNTKQTYPVRQGEPENFVGGEVLIFYIYPLSWTGLSTFSTSAYKEEDGELAAETNFDLMFPDEPGNPQVPTKFYSQTWNHNLQTTDTAYEHHTEETLVLNGFQIEEGPTFGEPDEHPGQWRIYGVHQLFQHHTWRKWKVQEGVIDAVAESHGAWAERCGRYKIVIITITEEQPDDNEDLDRTSVTQAALDYYKEALEEQGIEVEIVDGGEGDEDELIGKIDSAIHAFYDEEEEPA